VAPDAIPQWAIKLTAVVAVIVIAILCVATPKLGTRSAVLFTVIKVSDQFPLQSKRKVNRILVRVPSMLSKPSMCAQNHSSCSKIAVAVLGAIQILRGKMSSSLTDPLFSGTSPNPSSYAIALYSGLW
jgi:hypothetical protein